MDNKQFYQIQCPLENQVDIASSDYCLLVMTSTPFKRDDKYNEIYICVCVYFFLCLAK